MAGSSSTHVRLDEDKGKGKRSGQVKKQVRHESVDWAAEAGKLDYATVSPTNHRFDFILSKSHLGPSFSAFLPAKIQKVLPEKTEVPVLLLCNGMIWNLFYTKSHTFNSGGWRKFVTDNKLGVGDACFFELLENSSEKIVFKVIILKTAFPAPVDGTSSENPVALDD